MAMDFLSAPATSCDMERGFSKSGYMVSAKRHNLKKETVCSAQLVASWAQAGLLPEAQLTQMFNDKRKRGKNKVTKQ
jgi:hypothetical protein